MATLPTTADRILLVHERIDTNALVDHVRTGGDGAIVTFDGCVRNQSHGRRTLYLDYEAYESMALAKMREIAAEAHTKFAIDRVAVAHRLGRLEIGETSVFIAVSAPHRAAAFDACRHIIDTLKRSVPIWKKEYFEDGAVWADGELPPVPQDTGQQRGRIRVNVNLVNVLVSVLDDHNRPAADLPREAFQLFEEGVQQKIEVFEPETQLPLDLALMIDSSLSAHKEITFEQEAAAHFIRQVLRKGDRLSVFAVDEEITQLAAFSDDVGSLQATLRRMPAGSATSTYDAVLLGSRSLARRG